MIPLLKVHYLFGFFQDHVRAAMTCIRFFTHKAKSYTELGDKQKWLLKVKDHLKVYLQEVSRSSGRKKAACTFRKKMTATDVSRYLQNRKSRSGNEVALEACLG